LEGKKKELKEIKTSCLNPKQRICVIGDLTHNLIYVLYFDIDELGQNSSQEMCSISWITPSGSVQGRLVGVCVMEGWTDCYTAWRHGRIIVSSVQSMCVL